MFMNFILPSVATLLISSLTTVNAFVLTRDVIVPPVLYPTDGTQWVVGQRHNVTWDLSVVPAGFTGTGMIVLGFIDGSDDGSEHLDLNHPLANGFLISAGRTEITVPTVSDRSDYIVVLFGDSGNASGKFTIKNIGISSPGSTSTVSSSTGSVTSSSTTASSTSESGTDSATTTTDSNSTETGSTPAAGSTSDDAAPSTPANTATGAPTPSPSPTVAGFPVTNSGSSTPSAISSLTLVSPSSTAPASTQTSSNITSTQNNAGSPLGSINFAVVISAICAMLPGYVAL